MHQFIERHDFQNYKRIDNSNVCFFIKETELISHLTKQKTPSPHGLTGEFC